MKIAVTGATGFIGKHLVERLSKEDFHLRILVHNSSDVFKKEIHPLEIVKGDLLKKETLSDFVRDVDLVIHLAGKFSSSHEGLLDHNVITTTNLLEICHKNGVKNIIFTSSGAVYGEPPQDRASKETDGLMPNTFYGLTKKFAEDVVRYYGDNLGMKYVILRFPNVYGPGNNKGVIYNFLSSIKKGNKVTIYGDGKQARNFLFVSDAVRGILRVIEKHRFQRSEVFNISTKELITINELVVMIARLFQRNIGIIKKPQQDDSLRILREDIRKAGEILNWYPKISLEKGLKLTISSLK